MYLMGMGANQALACAETPSAALLSVFILYHNAGKSVSSNEWSLVGHLVNIS